MYSFIIGSIDALANYITRLYLLNISLCFFTRFVLGRSNTTALEQVGVALEGNATNLGAGWLALEPVVVLCWLLI